jgi:hypothetical protein
VGSAGQREGTSTNGRPALTERVHRTERENGREREGIDADMPGPPGSGRERARVRRRRWSLAGGVHLSGDAGARAAWLGRAGLIGLKMFFFLFPENF